MTGQLTAAPSARMFPRSVLTGLFGEATDVALQGRVDDTLVVLHFQDGPVLLVDLLQVSSEQRLLESNLPTEGPYIADEED